VELRSWPVWPVDASEGNASDASASRALTSACPWRVKYENILWEGKMSCVLNTSRKNDQNKCSSYDLIDSSFSMY
jgi:hypothetical protein